MRLAELSGELQRRIALRPALAVALELALGLALSAALLWAFAEFSEEVLEGESRRFDRAALLWVANHTPGWLAEPLRVVTSLGYFRVVLPVAAVLALVFYRVGSRASAALILLSTAGGILLNTVLKASFRRDRPTLIESGYESSFFSFPSGHATVAVCFYGALTLIAALRLDGAGRWLVLATGTLWALLMGFSRIYLGVHFPSDILAGYLAALTWLAVVCLALRLWRLRGGLEPPQRKTKS
ncbi:MAG: phosphatase PAP2 family protein [Rubrobacter sp.]|nr:phosphatase PAP2 family protein [Rubrobacter sp.]